jgi:hypothetical protein
MKKVIIEVPDNTMALSYCCVIKNAGANTLSLDHRGISTTDIENSVKDYDQLVADRQYLKALEAQNADIERDFAIVKSKNFQMVGIEVSK